MHEKFIGTGVAIVTPFLSNNIDFPSLGKIIDHLIDNGIDYIVVLGSTGEASMVSNAEAIQILDYAVHKINKRVPIVAGNFTGNNTREVCGRLINHNLSQIDALLISSPAYVKPTQEGIYQHYVELSKHTDRPIIIYNVPGRTSSNVSWDTTVRLANYSNQFIGIKEASADMVQCEKIIAHAPKEFLMISGDDPTALALCGIGGHGVISVLGNAYPAEFSSMISNSLGGNYNEARRINQSLLDLHHWMYLEGNPTGVKAALEIKGLCSREVRMPLISLSEKSYDCLKEEMNKVG